MEIDRRQLLSGAASLAMTGLAGSGAADRWHPLTRSLIDRARRVGSDYRPADTTEIERVISTWPRHPVARTNS